MRVLISTESFESVGKLPKQKTVYAYSTPPKFINTGGESVQKIL